MNIKTTAWVLIPTMALSLVTSGGVRAGNLVMNGDFEAATFSTGSDSTELANGKGWTTTGGLTNWNVGANAGGGTPFLLWFNASNATTVSAHSQYSSDPQKLDAAFVPLATGGSHFVALDGDSGANAPLYQSIAGLTVGQSYAVTFESAAVQLTDKTGATTESLQVTLGTDSQTLVITDSANKLPSQGFSGWATNTFDFTAKSATETLSFLSIGTPNGLPPMVLLDNVDMEAVPEPASFFMMGVGILALLAVGLRRRARSAAVAV